MPDKPTLGAGLGFLLALAFGMALTCAAACMEWSAAMTADSSQRGDWYLPRGKKIG